MDSTSAIMSIIRVLNSQSDSEDRNLVKDKLDNYLVATDRKLDEQVAENYEDLMKVMQTFIGISNNLQSTSAKLARTKKRLVDCHESLTKNLKDLNNLSEESKKNEKIIILLDQVDELLRIPTKITELLNNREYLTATKLLVEKQKYIDDHFQSFDCLREVRTELDSKREEVYRILKEKLLTVDDGSLREDIIESLKLIDKTPELPDLEQPKEKAPAPTTNTLFKFSLSSHAMCFNEHYKEQTEVTKTLLSK